MTEENAGYGDDNAATPQDVEDPLETPKDSPGEAAAPVADQNVCPECGKVCASPPGLKNHITCAHTRGRRPKRPGKQPRKIAKAGKPAPATGGFREVFEGVAKQINQVGEILDQCVAGLDVLVTAAKELRKKYIKNTSQLQKLQRAVDMNFKE